MTTTCTWCGTPMTGDLLGDQMHPGCDGPTAGLDPETLGPCAICGQITTRYDGADSTLCPDCQTEVTA